MKFLTGDKKSELLAEIKFVKYAYDNFPYIMANDKHREATLCNIQFAKK